MPDTLKKKIKQNKLHFNVSLVFSLTEHFMNFAKSQNWPVLKTNQAFFQQFSLKPTPQQSKDVVLRQHSTFILLGVLSDSIAWGSNRVRNFRHSNIVQYAVQSAPTCKVGCLTQRHCNGRVCTCGLFCVVLEGLSLSTTCLLCFTLLQE